jgi:hypothetical protein
VVAMTPKRNHKKVRRVPSVIDVHFPPLKKSKKGKKK